MTEKKRITDRALREAFGGTGDFVVRNVDVGRWRLRVYFIDGLTSGGDISDFVVKPLSKVLEGARVGELLERAVNGAVYNAVAEPASDLDAAISKLLNGFTLEIGRAHV